MPTAPDPEELKVLKVIDSIADEFEQELNAGRRPRIEPLLRRVEPSHVGRLLKELLSLELDWRAKSGQTLVTNDYLQRFPQHQAIIETVFSEWETRSGGGAAGTVDSRDTQQVGGAGESAKKPKTPHLPPLPPVPGASRGRLQVPGKLGRFELKQQLGAGSFGAVYLAHDSRLGRDVALKVPHSAQPADSNRRFLAEARSAAKLKHPGIITIYDSDIVDDSLYIACEYINGGDMAQIFKQKQTSLKQLVAWLRDAARALAYAHAEGVIHRDVKPSNLLVSDTKQVYVSDFGLARRVDDNSSLTADGSVLGTPAYMAPEQAAGKRAAVGPASDQYSVGVMLYEVLTGRVPFRGNIQQILQKVVKDPPQSPRELNPQAPPDLEAVCLKALAKNPAHRYPDLNAFADDLDCWLQGRPVSIRPPEKPGFKDWFRNQKTLHMFGSAVLLVLVIVLGVYLAFMGTGSSSDTAQNTNPGGGAANGMTNDGADATDNADPQMADGQQATNTRQDDELKLQRQREELQAAIQPDQTWECRLPTPTGATRPVLATFLTDDQDASSALMLLTDPSDATRKSLWQGTMRLIQNGAALFGPGESPAWSLPLSRVSGDASFPSDNLREIVLTSSNGSLTWVNLPEPVVMEQLPQPLDLPTMAELRIQIEQYTRPGQVWEGTLQEPSQASRRVRLTFTESRDDGQHVRAILESIDSGFAMSPFLGTIDWSPGMLIAGQPIRLVRQAQAMGSDEEWEIFRTPYLSPEIHLGLTDDGGLVGTAGSAQLQLSKADDIENFAPFADQWLAAMSAGTIWSGVMRLRDEPPTRVNLTLAEVRDDMGYVRLLFESVEDPHLFTIYEGAVNVADEVVDGFACTMDIALNSPTQIPGRQHGLFGTWYELSHAIRLSPDGERLLMRTDEGEQITFTRLDDSAPLPLDRSSFAETWQAACQSQLSYEGVLRNISVDISTGIRLDFLGEPDDLGNVSVMLTVIDKPTDRMRFDGTLQVGTDADVNAFALKLTKTGSGEGGSVLFGQSREGDLRLRLNADGRTLIGMAGTDGNWVEFMELEVVEP